MKGHQDVVVELNKILTSELTAINQYFLHARMLGNWGFEVLNKAEYKKSIQDMKHADKLIERILFLEGTPDVASRDPLKVGKDVPEMLKNDLQVEYEVGQALKDAIAVCEQEKDYQTREILEVLLRDTEEDHTYWLEQQLGLIDKIGIQNYLQSQMG